MRKTFLVLIMILVLSGTAFSQTLQTKSEAIAVSAPIISPTVNSKNDSGAIAAVMSSPNYLQPQPIYPYLLQMIPGVIADVTKDMPLYDIIDAYDKTKDRVIKSKTYNGWCWDRIRLEDVKQEVLDHLPKAMKALGAKSYSEVRYDTTLKMSSRTGGFNIGGGGATAGFGGGANPMSYGSNGTGIGAVAVNTADPQFQITYYLIKITDQSKKVSEIGPQGGAVSQSSATILYQAPSPPKESPVKKTVFGKEVSD